MYMYLRLNTFNAINPYTSINQAQPAVGDYSRPVISKKKKVFYQFFFYFCFVVYFCLCFKYG